MQQALPQNPALQRKRCLWAPGSGTPAPQHPSSDAAQRGPPAAWGCTRDQVEEGPGRSGGRGARAQMKWIQLSSHSPRGMCSAWLRHVRL